MIGVRRTLLHKKAVVVSSGITTIFSPSPALNQTDSSFTGGTLRNVVTITAGSSGRVRATFKAGPTTFTVDHASIGVWTGTAGDTTATPIELLFSGGHGFSIASGASITSDFATLAFTGANKLVVTIDTNSVNADLAKGTTETNCDLEFQTAFASYNATTIVGGSFAGGLCYGLNLVETSV